MRRIVTYRREGLLAGWFDLRKIAESRKPFPSTAFAENANDRLTLGRGGPAHGGAGDERVGPFPAAAPPAKISGGDGLRFSGKAGDVLSGHVRGVEAQDREATAAVEPAIRVRGLRRSYVAPDGQRSVVVDIGEFVVPAGGQIALRGGSGSGKTTFLHLLSGILVPDAGTVEIAGEPMTGVSESVRDQRRARLIGYIFQTFNLLQGYTAIENVELAMRFGRGLDRRYARELLERVGLGARLKYRPAQLSVGQQQRVAVARAVANHPPLVLADEPTGNLDARNADDAIELIRSLCRESGASLLLVSHDERVLAHFPDVHDFSEINAAAAPAEGRP